MKPPSPPSLFSPTSSLSLLPTHGEGAHCKVLPDHLSPAAGLGLEVIRSQRPSLTVVQLSQPDPCSCHSSPCYPFSLALIQHPLFTVRTVGLPALTASTT